MKTILQWRSGNFFRFCPVQIALLALLALCGCSPLQIEKQPRFFWPPPPAEAKIEYLNFYFSNEDLLRGVDRRLEHAILGRRNPERLVNQPYTVASDGKGRIFVGDYVGRTLTVLDRSAHTSRHLLVMKGAPQKVLVDQQGEIWALDGLLSIVYHFDAEENLLSSMKLKGITRTASMTVDSQRQRLYLSDPPNHRICVFDYFGKLLSTLGSRGRDDGQFNYPTDLDIDGAGNLYVVDSMNARIQIFTPDGLFLRAFGERGTERGSFFAPKGIAVSPSGVVYVTDANQSKVVIFNDQGEYLLTLGGAYVYDGSNVHPGGLNFPAGIDVDAHETIFVADFFNGMIHEFQYLSPEYLAQHPIRVEDVYNPQSSDFAPPHEEEKEILSLPIGNDSLVKPAETPALKANQ